MNSSPNKMAESSPKSQSRGTKRKTTEERAKVAAKRPRIVSQDNSGLFSFIRHLFSSVSSMFERKEKRDTVTGLSDTTDNFYTCSEMKDSTTELNTTELNTAELNTTKLNTTELNTAELNTTKLNTTELNTAEVNTVDCIITEDNTTEDKSTDCIIIDDNSTNCVINNSTDCILIDDTSKNCIIIDNTTECIITEDNTTDDKITDGIRAKDNTTDYNTTEDNFMILLHERIAIYNNDLDCLEEGKYLNDKIIDLFLSLQRNSYEQNQTYVFDSMFFIKLKNIQDPKNYYSKTSRWFKNGVLSKKIWVIPVCDNYHWYVITIINPESVRPEILVMDSWKRKYYTSADIVKEFLKQKFSAEQKGDMEGINVKIVDIPQQTNNYDCGLYAIHSAELFMTKLAPSYIRSILGQENKISSTQEIYQKVELLTRNQMARYFIEVLKNDD